MSISLPSSDSQLEGNPLTERTFKLFSPSHSVHGCWICPVTMISAEKQQFERTRAGGMERWPLTAPAGGVRRRKLKWKKVLCNRNEPIRDQNSTEQVPKRIKSTIKAAVIKNHASFFFVVHLFGFLVGRNTRLILEPTAGLSNSFIMLCWKFILRKHEFSKSQKFSFLLRSS